MTIGVTRLAFCAVLCSSISSGGYGQTSAEQSYLNARREAESTFTARARAAGGSTPAMLALHKAALTDLERRLRPVIGAVDVRGFPHAGRISLESLFQGDLSFGMMDG